MSEEQDESPSNPDIHFEPIVKLPLVEVKTFEEDEETLVKLRAKLFRYDCSENPAEWKERGTGEVKLLKHCGNGTVRIVMRRDKTLKICANHYVHSNMELKPNCNSDRAWIWSTLLDCADDLPRPEVFAIRFANAEYAQKFKVVFEEAKKYVEEEEERNAENDSQGSDSDGPTEEQEDNSNEVLEKMKDLSVKEVEDIKPEINETQEVITSDSTETQVKPSCKTKEDDGET